MSMQRVNFPRNLLAAQACLSAFTGLGLLAIEAASYRAWVRIRRNHAGPPLYGSGNAWLLRGLGPALVLALLWAFPVVRPGGELSLVEPDSRQQLVDWLIETAPRQHCRLVAPVELGLNPSTIEHHCRLWTFEASSDDATPEGVAEALAPLRRRRHIYLALPSWKEDAERWNALAPLLALERAALKVGHLKMRLDGKRTHGNPRIALFELGTGAED
jgi:hypothetical protein